MDLPLPYTTRIQELVGMMNIYYQQFVRSYLKSTLRTLATFESGSRADLVW